MSISVGFAGGFAGGIEKFRFCAPYYWQWLRSLPYGVIRRITRRRCRGYSLMEPWFKDKYGLEIGGPSPIFGAHRLIPVYDRCREMDNCNFSSRTLWDSPRPGRQSGFSFVRQWVAEASNLSGIADETYDFVLASHVLEHTANPLQALCEWKRVLKPGGAMLVIVPDRRGTFDHRRPATSFDHIEADFKKHTSEEDLTHLEEILALHDLALDPAAGAASQFTERCRRNFSFRAMHHHVFTLEVLVRMFAKLQLRLLSLGVERPSHIIAFAQSTESGVEQERVKEKEKEKEKERETKLKLKT